MPPDPVALEAVLTQIKYFGQTPPQLLEHEHPRRLPQEKCIIPFGHLVDHLCNVVFSYPKPSAAASSKPSAAADQEHASRPAQRTRDKRGPIRVQAVNAWMLLSSPPAPSTRSAAPKRTPEGVCAVFYMSNSVIAVYQDFRVACHAFGRSVRKMHSWCCLYQLALMFAHPRFILASSSYTYTCLLLFISTGSLRR